MYNIGLIGKAQSGKDTAAGFLVRGRRYTPLAFADPLRAMLLDINPYVHCPGVTVRLESLVADVGWDYAKTQYPEVRRLLQRVGQTMRERDPDYWVSNMRRLLNGAERLNMPVVVTDVRYRNEADMLVTRGFRLVRIVRPGASAGGSAASHSSETELDDYATPVTIRNNGSVGDLRDAILAAAGA